MSDILCKCGHLREEHDIDSGCMVVVNPGTISGNYCECLVSRDDVIELEVERLRAENERLREYVKNLKKIIAIGLTYKNDGVDDFDTVGFAEKYEFEDIYYSGETFGIVFEELARRALAGGEK